MALLETHELTRTFAGKTEPALDEVTLSFEIGETVGIVGESGSGKTTLARQLVGLQTPTTGSVTFQGSPIPTSGTAFRAARQELQLIPQHASGALNPRVSLRGHFNEVIHAHNLTDRAGASELINQRLAEVRLDPSFADVYPRRMSGGQQQRAVIARSLLVEPTVLICDEPTSALDVLIQEDIMDLLRTRCISADRLFLLITHDLNVAARLCNRLIVMNRGRVVEDQPTSQLLTNPRHPYTRDLLRAADLSTALG